jgi:8-amino-7-oxononanoate synthase
MKTSKFNKIQSSLGRTIVAEGQSYLYFGGTAYLGMPSNPHFKKYYLEGLDQFGLNNGTSRSNNVQLDIYNQAEQEASIRFGAEASLITSSGYLAAQLSVRHFADWGQVIYAPVTHPALWHQKQQCSVLNFKNWSDAVVKDINNSTENRFVLISNSMNNLFPEEFDFSFLSEISDAKEVLLIVDDSHGIGILNEGIGCFPGLPTLRNVKTIVVASLAKALGVDAGLISGPEELIRELKHTNVFYGASPPSAAGLYAFINSAEIYREEFQKLKSLMSYFDQGLSSIEAKKETTAPGFLSLKDFPVYLSTDSDLNEKLISADILISSFAYPGSNGGSLNRIVLSSWHQEADLEKLLNILREVG